MRKIIKVSNILIFFLSFTYLSYGQNRLEDMARKQVTATTGVLVCSVVDENNQPVEYATITVLNVNDSSMVTGSITNERGVSFVDAIPWGSYIVRVGFVGYKNLYSKPLTFSKSEPVVQLLRQKIQPISQQIEGVVVTGQKEMIQANLDKKVFNVDQSIVSEGATGLEVLENIPSVQVDIEGNVSLRGSESVTILIDGRPTNLTLDQIPSSMIESVELITNPSARFEPDGVSGIINVVLKKKKESGFNGMATIGAGVSNLEKKFNFGRYNASINLNYRYNKVNVFANYDFRSHSRMNKGQMERQSVFKGDTTFLYQESNGTGGGMSHNVRTGLDYFINKQNTFSFSVSYNNNVFKNESEAFSQTSKTSLDNAIEKEYDQTNDRENYSQNVSGNLFYKHEFKKKGQELTADVYYSHMWRDNNSMAIEKYTIPKNRNDFYNQTISDSRNQNLTAQVDFVSPIGNGGRLEAGYKFSLRNTFQNYLQQTGSSKDSLSEVNSDANNYDYDEYIHAVYLIYSNTIKEKFKYQIGLRGELANTVFFLHAIDTTAKSFYPNLFPTLHLVYDFNKKHALSLSYSMRVRRPNIWQLNPYTDNSDRLNLSKGNPNLKPELTHSVDLGYQFYTEKSSVTANIFYRYRDQMISRYTELLSDSVSLTSYQNFNYAQSYGIELYYSQTIFKWWKASVNGSFYQTLLSNEQKMIDSNLLNDWSWRVRGTFNFILPKDWDIQLSANYRSPMLTTGSMGWGGGGAGQGRTDSQWSMDLGIKKSFLKKTLTMSIRVSDIFGTRKSNVHTFGSDEISSFDARNFRQHDSRQLWASLSYKINNYRPKRETRRDNDDYPTEE